MIMTNKCFVFFAVFLMISVFSERGSAQDCNVQFETIFEMPEPTAGSYNVWQRVFGDPKKRESFVSGVSLRNKNTLVVGSSLNSNSEQLDLLLAELDRRGRTVWSREHKIAGFVKSVKVVDLLDNGFLAMADLKKAPKSNDTLVWLGFFDTKGALKESKTISLADKSLNGLDVVKKHDGSGFFIASFVKNLNGKGGFSRIYDIDIHGKVIKERSFVPGLENKILSLSPYGKKYYMASGYIRNNDGRKIAWVLQLGSTGQIVWERQYPRGRAAQFNSVSQFIMNFAVLAGESHPYGEGNLAAWVMVLDADNGQIAWQRYYRGDLDYSAKSLVSMDNGLISALVNAGKPENSTNGQDYVRLLTINPRGVLFLGDEYFNGDGSVGNELIMGAKKERIIIGQTDVLYQIEDPKTGDIVNTQTDQEGWVVAAAPMESYKDPCANRSFGHP